MKKPLLSLAIGAALAIPAHAGDTFQEIGLGVKMGTLGVGVDLTTNLMPGINLRGNINLFNYSRSMTKDGVEYNGDLKLQSAGILGDWHPFSNGFRLSAGAYINKNKFSLSGKPTAGTFTLDSTTYQAGEAEIGSLDGTIKFNDVAPYVGIGWGNAISKSGNWNFVADAGLLYQGAPKVGLNVSCGSLASQSTCDAAKASASAEQSRLAADVSDYKWYPVLSIGASYRF